MTVIDQVLHHNPCCVLVINNNRWNTFILRIRISKYRWNIELCRILADLPGMSRNVYNAINLNSSHFLDNRIDHGITHFFIIEPYIIPPWIKTKILNYGLIPVIFAHFHNTLDHLRSSKLSYILRYDADGLCLLPSKSPCHVVESITGSFNYRHYFGSCLVADIFLPIKNIGDCSSGHPTFFCNLFYCYQFTAFLSFPH